ncbi:hypothetical protein ACUW9C_000694 [Staphylococcus hominis]
MYKLKCKERGLIHPNIIKIMTIISNIFVILGIIFLIMMKLMLAIAMFAVSLTISLVIFNVLFRDRTGMKIIINISFAIVVIAIIVAYSMLSK